MTKGLETLPPTYSPYPRRPFADVITKAVLSTQFFLRPWVLVRPESNSQPPASQPDPQPTEPLFVIDVETLNIAIHESKDIEGIQVGEGIIKLCAFADDLTIYVGEKCEISSRITKSHQDVWRHLWLEIK